MATKKVDTDLVGKVTTRGEKMVTVKVPYVKGEAREQYVGINGRRFLIQKGKEIEVPECVAEVIRNSEAQIDAALDYIESLSTESSPN